MNDRLGAATLPLVIRKSWFLGLFLLLLPACATIYYDTWEALGKQKRDLLRDHVADAGNEQKALHDGFKDALSHLQALYGARDGKLQDAYDQIKADHDDATKRAAALHDRINKVEEVGGDLFEEWEDEAKEISNAAYRQDSLAKLRSTKKRFEPMLAAMRRSEKAMAPVLVQLNDQMLYLKHNLNAQALGSLKAETQHIQSDIGKVMADMKASIKVSEDFIKTLAPSDAP